MCSKRSFPLIESAGLHTEEKRMSNFCKVYSIKCFNCNAEWDTPSRAACAVISASKQPILCITQNSHFTTFLKKNIYIPTCASEAQQPEPLVPLHHVWVFPVWRNQTKARPRLVVSPNVRQRHGQNRIRVDSCWCALHFMSVLRGEICKRDRHRKPPCRDLQLAWN